MKLIASLAIFGSVLAAQPARTPPGAVTAVRHWSLGEVTRVAVQISREFHFRTDRLHNPERVYFDIVDAVPSFRGKRKFDAQLKDPLVSQIRVRETAPAVTRIVLDLSGELEVSTSQLANPNRLMIEVRRAKSAPAVSTATTALATPPAVAKPELPKSEPPSVIAAAPLPGSTDVTAEPSRSQMAKGATADKIAALEKPAQPPEAPKPAPILPAETGKAARPTTSSGSASLVRALGLKVGRIVIDPGHGGHDQGTEGAKGLLEKELVLDVSMRLGKLVEEKMGAEVVYTRTDDTFIPLEERTAFATDKKADLFLSIHANSSPVARIAGVETYYLNFTDAKDAMAVASRENASSGKSVFELQDIVKKITLHDKAEESKEFAARIQTALYKFSRAHFPGIKDRGVRKAPFIVLIGATIPSVLAEIGFLSNSREEALLKKPEYRQKVAEALFAGLKSYADGLSHFQVAQAKN